MFMHMQTAVCCLLLSTGVIATLPARADVTLTFSPTYQSAVDGQVIEVRIVAVADGSAEAVQTVEVILRWDPDRLELVGADQETAGSAWQEMGFPPNPDGLNDGVTAPWGDVPDNDGDAFFMALATAAAPAMASPSPGLVVTTLRFRALTAGDSETTVSFLESYGAYSFTRVLAPEPPATEITGDVSGSTRISIEEATPAQLALEVPRTCLSEVAVELWMRDLQRAATGFQAFLAYNDSVLQFRGDLSSYSPSPFEGHVQALVDAEVRPGQLNLDGFTYTAGTDVDALLATLRFQIVQECEPTAVIFRTVAGFESELSFQGVALLTVTRESPLFAADETPPDVTYCPGDMVTDSDAGECAALVSWMDPTFFDGCGLATVSQTAGPPSGTTFAVGQPVPVAYTAVDACGNATTCTFTVTVEDTEPPTPQCPDDIVLPCDPGECGAAVNWASSVLDNCPGASVMCSPPSGSFFEVGTTDVICTATDAVDLTATRSFSVTVLDDEAPTISCPDPVTVVADSEQCAATGLYLGEPEYHDNCPGAALSTDAPAEFPVGQTTVTWTVTDGAGLSSHCSQLVTVVDAQPPTIVCPPDITVEVEAGAPGAEVFISQPSVADACGAVRYTNDYTGTEDASAFYPVGSTPVTWTAVDEAGLTASCTEYVTVTAAPPLELRIALAPTVVSRLTRCIRLELNDCSADPPAIVDRHVELTFIDGIAAATVPLPPGTYDCVTVSDPLHTLGVVLSDLVLAEGVYVADFVAAGQPLRGGNLNDDAWIDILDFGLYVQQWGTAYGSGDTNCGTPWPHADINGDGLVTPADFSFICINFLAQGHQACCAETHAADTPLTAISVTELQAHGLGTLRTADLNGDGELDEQDIAAFLRGARPRCPANTGLSPNARY